MIEKGIEIELSHNLQHNTHDIYYFYPFRESRHEMIGRSLSSEENLLELEMNTFFHIQTLGLHKSIHGNPYLSEVLICIYKVIFFYLLFQQKT